jgi:Uma2 family endonuclease
MADRAIHRGLPGENRMSTVAELMTADELLRLPRGRFRYELIRGRLITMSPSGSEHGVVAMRLSLILGPFVAARNLGVLFGAETGFRLERSPDTVRAPDVAFISHARISPGGIPQGYWTGPPELAVEVVSPNDTPREVSEKAADWIRFGARAVWVVDPDSKTVTVYAADGSVKTLVQGETLDGGDVLPGFRCDVSDIFRIPGVN